MDAHVISNYFFDQLPISTDLEAKYGNQEQSCIVDLYNQIENITKINDQMREQILIPHFKQFYLKNQEPSESDTKEEKYSFFDIFKWFDDSN